MVVIPSSHPRAIGKHGNDQQTEGGRLSRSVGQILGDPPQTNADARQRAEEPEQRGVNFRSHERSIVAGGATITTNRRPLRKLRAAVLEHRAYTCTDRCPCTGSPTTADLSIGETRVADIGRRGNPIEWISAVRAIAIGERGTTNVRRCGRAVVWRTARRRTIDVRERRISDLRSCAVVISPWPRAVRERGTANGTRRTNVGRVDCRRLCQQKSGDSYCRYETTHCNPSSFGAVVTRTSLAVVSRLVAQRSTTGTFVCGGR